MQPAARKSSGWEASTRAHTPKRGGRTLISLRSPFLGARPGLAPSGSPVSDSQAGTPIRSANSPRGKLVPFPQARAKLRIARARSLAKVFLVKKLTLAADIVNIYFAASSYFPGPPICPAVAADGSFQGSR